MHKKHLTFSFCVGVYNEEKIIVSAIKKIDYNLKKILGKNCYEIIIVDNGSTDKTLEIAKNIKNRNLRFFSIKEKAHGLALKTAIQKAKNEFIVVTGIDLPFGFKDLKSAIKLLKTGEYDIVFGSKAHQKSIIETNFKRKVSSTFFRFLLRRLFSLKIGDPQGSIFFKKSKLLPLLKNCTSKNAFFTTELAIYSANYRLRMIEIPVEMKSSKTRASKYSIIKDGSNVLSDMLKKYYQLNLKRLGN